MNYKKSTKGKVGATAKGNKAKTNTFFGGEHGDIEPSIAANFDGLRDVLKTLPNGEPKNTLLSTVGALYGNICAYAKRVEWLSSVSTPIEA